MADQSIWDKFSEKNYLGDYILVYSVGPINNLMDIAEKISNKLGMKVYCITGKKIDNQYNHKHLKGKSPKELLSLLNNANFVVTNSFHGTAFSIIFNKSFITIPHKKSGARMVELLKLLNLEERLVRNCKKICNLVEKKIDYKIVNKILKDEKHTSLNFLTNSISNQAK